MSDYDCWNPEMERMEPARMKELQGNRLAAVVARVFANVPFYAAKMRASGIAPKDVSSLEDLTKLPFTRKTDLRDNYPFGTFAVPLKDVVRVHASSGTTGKQTVVGYTSRDIDTWSEVMARALANVGVTEHDVVHVAYGYGLFTGGLGFHYGVEKLGATVVPISGGNTARQLQLMIDFGATVLACTPSYALHLAGELEAAGIRKEDLKLRIGIFGAEPWSEAMRRQIEERLGLKAYDVYGLSEIIGPGVSMDCVHQNGLHVASDHFYPEIVDPVTGETLPDGQRGELVFTCLTKEALPLIRYRTGDLTVLHTGTCACGRTNPRMEKVTGRTDDMLIIRGVNVFPSQIESVLLSFGEVDPHYMIHVDRVDNLDQMEIQVEMTTKFFSDEIRRIEETEHRLGHDLHATLGIWAKVRLVEPKTLPRSEGKAKRVMDKRVLF